MKIQIEEGSFEYFYMLAVIAFWSPVIIAKSMDR